MIELIEEVDHDDWKEAETFWVDYLRFLGIELANTAMPGGGATHSYVANLTPEIEAQLGIVGDDILAAQAGVTRKAISYHRSTRKIPASFDSSRMKPPPPMGGWNAKEFTEHQLAKLGSMPDYVLAKELGTNKRTIARHREMRGIASYADQTGNTGRLKPGNYPGRWLKRDGQ